MALVAASSINPARPLQPGSRSLTASAGQAFGLPELRAARITAEFAARSVAVRVDVQSFGFDAYREGAYRAGIGLPIRWGTTRPLFVGAAVTLHTLAISSYGQAQAVGVDLGVWWRLLPMLDVGIVATDINRPRWHPSETLRTELLIGAAYRPHEQVLLVGDLVSTLGTPLAYTVGVEYQAVGALSLRTGLATQPTRYSVGVGLHVPYVAIDLAAERHDALGWSPTIGVTLAW